VPTSPLRVAITVYILRDGSWQAQPAATGPSFVGSLATFRGALLAVDTAGRTWTSDGHTWHEAGVVPLAYQSSTASMVEDTDRHVVVLVGGFPTASVPTYEWDGSAWHLRSGTLPPVPTAPPLPAGEPSSAPPPPLGEPSILPAPVP
jgi:hypothetical protein